MQRLLVALAVLSLAACGSDEGGGDGPSRIDVALTVSTAPLEHTDGYSGQTPENASAGFSSLTLLPDSGEPWVVVDRSTSPLIVEQQSGARILLGTVFSEQAQLDHYSRARVVLAWSRFEIAATLHETDGATPGRLTALHVTSNGTRVGSETRDAGYYVHDFEGGTKTGHWTGTDLPLPGYTSPSGTEVKLEDGQWATYFPVDLQIDSGDAVLTIDVNLHEAFRWQDAAEGENQPGAYDFAPPSYEPIRQYGGSRFDAKFEGR